MSNDHPISKIMNGWVWGFIAAIGTSFTAGIYLDDLYRRSSDYQWISSTEIKKKNDEISRQIALITRLNEELSVRNAMVFSRPTYKDIRVDKHFDRSGSEENAANAFCNQKWQGSTHHSFKVDGNTTKTIYLNDTILENGGNPFIYIVCLRSNQGN